jgi:dTMP kinase
MGKLIVIDGLDGSGKATQTAKLAEYLNSKGQAVKKVTFPNYDDTSSALVKMYLSGEISQDMNEVNSYASSSFYACDRYISYKKFWEKDYKSETTIVADRYVSSNLIHQMVKLDKSEWDEFTLWLYDLEFTKFKLPQPDIIIYLDMPPEVSKMLLSSRYDGDETKRDLHEQNFEYLVNCRDAALYVANKLEWEIINCSDGENPYSIDEIFEKIKDAIC